MSSIPAPLDPHTGGRQPKTREHRSPTIRDDECLEALAAIDMAMWSWQLDSSRVTFSDHFYVLTGLAPGSVNSLSRFLSLLATESQRYFLEQVGRATLRAGKFTCHLSLVLPSGTWQCTLTGRVRGDTGATREVVGTVELQQNLQGLNDASTDTSEAAVLTSDELLRSVMHNASAAVSVKDVQGRYVLVNKRFAELFGKKEQPIVGADDFALFDEQTAKRIRYLDHSVLQANQLLQLEESFDLKQQAHTYLSVRFPIKDPRDNTYAIGQILTDISKHKAVEHAIEEQRNELHLLLDSVRACIWYLDNQGRIKHGNRQAEHWKPIAESRGKGFAEAMPFWDQPEFRQRQLQEVIDTAQAVYGSRESIELAGEQYLLAVDKIPTINNDGEVTGVLMVANDITKSAMQAAALEESRARYQAFVATISDVIWCYEVNPPIDVRATVEEQVQGIDEGARLVECNHYFARLYHSKSPMDLLGSNFADTKVDNYRELLARFVENDYRLLDSETMRRNRNDEKEFWQLSTIGTVEDGKLVRIWGSSKNVTESKRSLEKLRYQATHDALTQLPNRTHLFREIETAIANTNRKNNQQMALLVVDLDRFKEINDTLGHEAGDILLRQLGPRLEAELEEMPGLVARLGGDEFAVFLPRIRNPQQAVVFAHRLLDAAQQPFVIQGFHTELSASIGVSVFPNQARDVSTLMRYADVAMYRAKKEMIGVALYHAEQDPHSPKRLALMGELGRGIRENQLVLHYQPKIHVATGEIVGFEALVRWNHPSLGFVTPGEFIPIAENSGIIHALTAWVLENSIQQAKQWFARGYEGRVAVNLSPRNLLDARMATLVSDLLSKYQLPATCLELEITESAIMEDPVRALDVLNQIHNLGVRLSIDDFGTGYSSLAYLKKLPVQSLKIDYSFVQQMLEDEQDRIIVNSTIHLAHNLGLDVVAEGVETEAALEALNAMGCDYAQGYHILRPCPQGEIDTWLSEYRPQGNRSQGTGSQDKDAPAIC